MLRLHVCKCWHAAAFSLFVSAVFCLLSNSWWVNLVHKHSNVRRQTQNITKRQMVLTNSCATGQATKSTFELRFLGSGGKCFTDQQLQFQQQISSCSCFQRLVFIQFYFGLHREKLVVKECCSLYAPARDICFVESGEAHSPPPTSQQELMGSGIVGYLHQFPLGRQGRGERRRVGLFPPLTFHRLAGPLALTYTYMIIKCHIFHLSGGRHFKGQEQSVLSVM